MASYADMAAKGPKQSDAEVSSPSQPSMMKWLATNDKQQKCATTSPKPPIHLHLI